MTEKNTRPDENKVVLLRPLTEEEWQENTITIDGIKKNNSRGFEFYYNLKLAIQASFASVLIVGISWAAGYYYLVNFGHLFYH